jgi:predicted RNA-binding protein with PUA-like domain
MPRRYWLMKSEPDVYSIQDLEREGETGWEGVRNYQARNLMRDDMRVGDGVLFYHSNAKPPGVAGLARVCREAHPDPTAFDPDSDYHDPKSTRDAPRWVMVAVQHVETFPEVVSLDRLRETPGLEDMMVIKRGMRLSVQPVSKREFDTVAKLGRRKSSK